MAKGPKLRAIRAARTYTIEEAAYALNVSTSTIRNWVRAGLPIMRERRPYLILGEVLKIFLQDRTRKRKVPLQPGEFYCFTCKAARRPMGMEVEYYPTTGRTGRLLCLCDTCSGVANRMIGSAGLAALVGNLDVTMKDGRKPVRDTPLPL